VSSQSNTTGDYWLQAATENIAPKCGTAGEPIAPAGGTQTGDLAPTDPSGFRTTLGTHYHDDTPVLLERGQKLQAEPTARFDTYLYLVSPSCQTVAQNDDISYPSNTNSRVEYTAPSTGVYTLRATSFSNGVSGAWTLTTTHVAGY